MKKTFLILFLLSSSVFAKTVGKHAETLKTKPSQVVAPSNEEVFKTILKDLDHVGDISKKPMTVDEEQLLLIDRATTLATYRTGDRVKSVIIPEGTFLMLAPKKENLSSFDKKNYADIFSSDSYGSAFLYKDYIVTNYHMCRGLNTLVRDYQDKIYALKVLKWDDQQDVCILKAPAELLKQRNFATFKPAVDLVEEEKSKLRTEIKIERLKAKKYLGAMDAKKISTLTKELEDGVKNYGTVYSMWGEFKITQIIVDEQKDEWTKTNGFLGYGEKCRGGISGGVVSSPNGILGYSWGAETASHHQERLSEMTTERRSPSSKKAYDMEDASNPYCFFISVTEIERVLSEYEKELSKE